MTGPTPLGSGPVCPTPAPADTHVLLGHGSGGRLSAGLLRSRFLTRFGNPALDALGDAAVLENPGGRLVVSTDTFVVTPLEFPGGDIGSLAVHGTLNDLAMMGAEPRWLTAGFVLEEGLPFATLDRILDSMAGAARLAQVPVVTGDTKVVERGKADGLFINTTGIGIQSDACCPAPSRIRPDDAILVSGAIGRHGMAVMAARGHLQFETTITSDTACLVPLVRALGEAAGPAVHALRDPTRGGVASALNELAQAAGVGMILDERSVPIPAPVGAACAVLGLDPLYVANEGVLLAIVAPDAADAALTVLRAHPLGREAVRIGTVTNDRRRFVQVRTAIGSTRIVDLLPGDQLPRIC